MWFRYLFLLSLYLFLLSLYIFLLSLYLFLAAGQDKGETKWLEYWPLLKPSTWIWYCGSTVIFEAFSLLFWFETCSCRLSRRCIRKRSYVVHGWKRPDHSSVDVGTQVAPRCYVLPCLAAGASPAPCCVTRKRYIWSQLQGLKSVRCLLLSTVLLQ